MCFRSRRIYCRHSAWSINRCNCWQRCLRWFITSACVWCVTICLWLCSFNEVSGCGRAGVSCKHTGVFAYLCLNNITWFCDFFRVKRFVNFFHYKIPCGNCRIARNTCRWNWCGSIETVPTSAYIIRCETNKPLIAVIVCCTCFTVCWNTAVKLCTFTCTDAAVYNARK